MSADIVFEERLPPLREWHPKVDLLNFQGRLKGDQINSNESFEIGYPKLELSMSYCSTNRPLFSRTETRRIWSVPFN
jgi:hypothetical protein